MDRIEGRHAFITGGASGIGLAIARSLHAEGALVTIADFDDARLAMIDDPFFKLALDVRDGEAWDMAAAEAEAAHGPVAILCNNAGIGPARSELADMDVAVFERMIAIKLTGTMHGIRRFAPGMRERREGHIVNTGSMASVVSRSLLGEYGAAKMGLRALTEVLRAEMAPYGVGVSLLCPGLISTGIPGTMARLKGAALPAEMPAMPGLDADPVGRRVIEAIRGDWPYIFTHGERKGEVAAAFQPVVDALDATPDSSNL